MRGGLGTRLWLDLASFPDSSHVVYMVLTFELARTKIMAESLKVNTIYATRGESGNEAMVGLVYNISVHSHIVYIRCIWRGFVKLLMYTYRHSLTIQYQYYEVSILCIYT